jgi:hypothetical protein
MNYYLRRQPGASVEGPFTVPELIQGVRDGRISASSLVSSSREGTAESLRRYRKCDWSPVWEVPGMEEVVSAPEPIPVAPNPFLQGAYFVFLIVASGGSILRFVENPQWRTGLLPAAFSWLLAYRIYELVLEQGLIRQLERTKP